MHPVIFSNIDKFSFQVLSCMIFLRIIVLSVSLKSCINFSHFWNDHSNSNRTHFIFSKAPINKMVSKNLLLFHELYKMIIITLKAHFCLRLNFFTTIDWSLNININTRFESGYKFNSWITEQWPKNTHFHYLLFYSTLYTKRLECNKS